MGKLGRLIFRFLTSITDLAVPLPRPMEHTFTWLDQILSHELADGD